MSENKNTTLILKAADGERIEASAELLQRYCILIANLLDQMTEEKEQIVVPFYNLKGQVIRRVISFLEGVNPYVDNNVPITAENCSLQSVFKEDPFRREFFKLLNNT